MSGVCILTETYHPVRGGGETQARVLVEGLPPAGVPVQLVTRRSGRDLPRHDQAGRATILRVGPTGGGHLAKWGMMVTVFLALARLRRRYDAILVCGFRVLGIPAAMAAMLWRKPLVLKADSRGELSGAFFDPGLSRYGLRHDRIPVRPLLKLRNVLLRRADGFVAISSVIEEEYLDEGVDPARIARIPNSVDVSHFRPSGPGEREALRRRLDLPPDRPVAVYTGRLVTTKGLPVLLEAWRDVVERRPEALLVLVGAGGLGMQNCEEALRAFVARNGMERNVRFAGEVEDVLPWLQASDIFVFPSRREAFGISVIEAMACELPVVATDIEGVSDIVRPGVDALVVPVDDARALVAAVLRGLEGGPEIAAMGRAAREKVVDAYSAEQVVAAYRELLSEAGADSR